VDWGCRDAETDASRAGFIAGRAARGGRAIAMGRSHRRRAVGVVRAMDGVSGWGQGGSNEFERAVGALLGSTGGEVWAELGPHARIG
jgi:hypothetical protein